MLGLAHLLVYPRPGCSARESCLLCSRRPARGLAERGKNLAVSSAGVPGIYSLVRMLFLPYQFVSSFAQSEAVGGSRCAMVVLDVGAGWRDVYPSGEHMRREQGQLYRSSSGRLLV